MCTVRWRGKGAKKGGKTNKCQFCLYTYIHSWKTNIFPFFPKRTWKILKNCKNAKTKKQYIVPCYLWMAVGASCGQDITPYGSKPIFWKIIVHSNYFWGKKGKKPNISPFPATHTYIKLTLVIFLSFLFFAPFLNCIIDTTLSHLVMTSDRTGQRSWILAKVHKYL